MLSGPTAIVRDRPSQRRIPYISQMWSILDRSNGWCLEFLRFSREQICELAVLQIPDRFDNHHRVPSTTALAIACYRLSCPLRLKDCISEFGHERGWLSSVFNVVCTHLYTLFKEKLEWDTEFLTPERLQY
jgi:hypothetical protein